jgi:hypothetical protein
MRGYSDLFISMDIFSNSNISKGGFEHVAISHAMSRENMQLTIFSWHHNDVPL